MASDVVGSSPCKLLFPLFLPELKAHRRVSPRDGVTFARRARALVWPFSFPGGGKTGPFTSPPAPARAARQVLLAIPRLTRSPVASVSVLRVPAFLSKMEAPLPLATAAAGHSAWATAGIFAISSVLGLAMLVLVLAIQFPNQAVFTRKRKDVKLMKDGIPIFGNLYQGLEHRARRLERCRWFE